MSHGKSRAVSPVIATVIMITIAVTAGIMVYVWSMSTIPVHDQSQQYERMAEEVAIDVVWFHDDGSVTVSVRNVGAKDAKIGAIYVDGVQEYSDTEGYMIPVGTAASFTLQDVSQNYHLFKVVTSRGNEAHGEYGPIYMWITYTLTTTQTSTYTAGATTRTTTVTSTIVTTRTQTTTHGATSTYTTTYTTTRTTTSTAANKKSTTTMTITSTGTSTAPTTYTTTETTVIISTTTSTGLTTITSVTTTTTQTTATTTVTGTI